MPRSKPKYELFDRGGKFIRLGSKEDARRLRLWRKIVHIFIFNKTGDLLVSRRPPNMRRYRSQITSSAGGHAEIGESLLAAARRELKEELGISVRLNFLAAVRFPKGRAMQYLFAGRSDSPGCPNPREIQATRFVTLGFLQKDLRAHPRRYAKPFALCFALYRKSAKRA